MTFQDHANLAYSTIPSGGAPAPAASGNSLKVANAAELALFPTPPFQATVWPPGVSPLDSNAEIIQVNGTTGADGFVIARAQGGTTAKSISAGWQIAATVTAKPFDDLEAAIDQKTVVTVGTSEGGDYVCSGIQDDVKIKAALAAVAAAGGGTVLVRKGSYNITSTIDMYDHTTLTGEGFGTKFNYANPGSSSQFGIRALNVTGAVISNFQFDGRDLLGGNPRNLVVLESSSKCIVEGLYLHDAPDSAIVLDQATSQHNIIRNNIIDTTDDIGIYVSVANNNLIIGNVILNTGSYGIRNVNSGAIRNSYIGNYVYNCGQGLGADGIRILNGDSGNVVGNTIIQSGQNGIYVGSPYVNVSGNSVIDTNEAGIYVDSTAGRGTITGNAVHNSSRSANNTYSGIYLHNAEEVTVTGNRSGDTGSGTRQKYGILTDGSANNNTIIGNSVVRNSTGGISVVGAGTIVANNGGQSDLTTKTAAYSLVATDKVIAGDASSSEFTILVPTAIGSTGRTFTFKRKNSGSNNIVIGTTIGQTIDGFNAWLLASQNDALTIESDGTSWPVINAYGSPRGFTTSTSSTSSSTSSTSSSRSSTSSSTSSTSTSSTSSTSSSISSTSTSASTSSSTSTTVIAFG